MPATTRETIDAFLAQSSLNFDSLPTNAGDALLYWFSGDDFRNSTVCKWMISPVSGFISGTTS